VIVKERIKGEGGHRIICMPCGGVLDIFRGIDGDGLV
jgi:hypothetical protein